MAWLRVGDNAATNPHVMALATVRGSDDRTLNEVFGFVIRCATQSAGHYTDYVIDLGTALAIAGTRAETLLKQAVEAGLVTAQGRGKKRTWRLVEDADFMHLRSKAEVDAERRRRKDTTDVRLTIPVRLRDGDVCRYCATIVTWGDQRGAKGATYDHLDITRPTTPDLLVVACRECNSRRGNCSIADDSLVTLNPPPNYPFFTRKGAIWLTKNGHPTDHTETAPGDGPAGPVGSPTRSADHATGQAQHNPRSARPGREAGHRAPASAATSETPSPRSSPDQAGARETDTTVSGESHDPRSARPSREAGHRAPASAATSEAPSRPGDPAPVTVPTTWDTPPPTPPPVWAVDAAAGDPDEPQPDPQRTDRFLTSSDQSQRETGLRYRDGSGRGGSGQDGQGGGVAGACPPSPDLSSSHSSSGTTSTGRRRRTRSRRST